MSPIPATIMADAVRIIESGGSEGDLGLGLGMAGRDTDRGSL